MEKIIESLLKEITAYNNSCLPGHEITIRDIVNALKQRAKGINKT